MPASILIAIVATLAAAFVISATLVAVSEVTNLYGNQVAYTTATSGIAG